MPYRDSSPAANRKSETSASNAFSRGRQLGVDVEVDRRLGAGQMQHLTTMLGSRKVLPSNDCAAAAPRRSETDEHDVGGRRSRAEHGLGCVEIQIAAFAALGGGRGLPAGYPGSGHVNVGEADTHSPTTALQRRD